MHTSINIDIEAHWKDEEGQWREFEPRPSFLYQSTSNVIAMFEGNKFPVVLHFDGGYICTKNVFKEVREKHGKNVLSFKSLKPSAVMFYETLL